VTARVLLVDDQRVIREGLALVLGLLPDVDLLGSSSNGLDALERVRDLEPDIVLMDLRMPHMDGVEATRRIRREHPDVQVIVLTTFADDASILGALEAGARGYLTKDAGADEIAHAIDVVSKGQALLDPAIQTRLVEHLGTAAQPPTRPTGDKLPDGLTQREAEVLSLIASGKSNDEIAARLVVSPATVKTHINHIFAKTEVRDRAQAVVYAYRKGLASEE
jgi:DNA-binding NarL/FixJ family response regulator